MSDHSDPRAQDRTFNRRSFIVGSGVAAATTAAAPFAAAQMSSAMSGSSIVSGRALPGAPESEYSHFMHGVASGDPTPASVILWTRVTVSPEATPGSGLGPEATVGWEVSTSPDFSTVVRSGTTVTGPEDDHTVHVDPMGLEPATIYFYRFSYNGVYSAVGRTKTAPAYDADVEQINFALASCANWEAGYFAAYRDMAERAERDELDAVVFLGDYIYEYPTGEYAGKSGVSRVHSPVNETITLADYRTRHGRYKQDLQLQRAHAAAPWIVIWDDHETANNSWREGAENHSPETEGPWLDRRNAGQKAYFEWLPVRATKPSDGGHIYRSLQFGSLVTLTMMDLRTYRDAEPSRLDATAAGREMLGPEQFDWLTGVVRNSTTTWNVMGNSVMIAPLTLGSLAPTSSEAVLVNRLIEDFSTLVAGIPFNPDQWDGFAWARNRLFDALAADDANVLFLTGDIHTEWANSIVHNGREIGCELVTSSISAANVGDTVTTYTKVYHPTDNPVSLLAERFLRGLNPAVNHVDFDAHGYAVARIRPTEVGMEFYRVEDYENPDSAVGLALTRLWRAGAGYV
ncbi:alkaline phosphatase D family protein [Corynebacterium liangguodongii]|uniref:Phosphodiesterase n=1 Tax=Corynebacterium liangguodongii TaxID=2079535 RepID=A0A2S0WFE9_9CORY|nr:alkaline phosphatase D family protein [Corynebacterium liangguodongii]AWB84513.1 phosphodiesterase [Corynebacterium liangguodongii]PWB98731.1 phosphodiesterase [Corynebacterium liangguodongii]